MGIFLRNNEGYFKKYFFNENDKRKILKKHFIEL